ncbi:hypothetical protein SCLCIDRAFT_141555, partial [Scleroderma citrinum Foug A]
KQPVFATVGVFFSRFYFKDSYYETDPFVIIAACYVAGKAEELPNPIKNLAAEAYLLFSHAFSQFLLLLWHGIKSFSSDNLKLAEMTFYLVRVRSFGLSLPLRAYGAM